MLIGSVASGLWPCGTVPVSRRLVCGNVMVPSRFVFPSWNDILFVCARTLAEFRFAFVCSSPSTRNRHLDRSLFFLKNFRALFHSPYLAFSVSLDWQKYIFVHNARRSREQICVCYDALLGVLAIGAVFNTRGTRDVSRQHLRQLSGIASESLAHSDETNNS